MQNYPIGIQSFQKLREGKFLYVDKTKHIYQLTQRAGHYLFARPRRFGKSLLVSTLQALYEGKKNLFKGLWIENHWDFTQTNPTVVIYFNAFQLQGNSLDFILQNAIREQVSAKGIALTADLKNVSFKSGFLFQELVQKLHKKTGRKVVVLIDEYDKPIVDFLEELAIAEVNQNILKSFYGILKPSDEHLELVFLTGVSKFSKISVFSDLNNLNDISLDEDFGTLVGITQAELENSFREEILNLAEKKNISQAEFLEKIKRWYNGYSWKSDKIYNPFSVLNFFSKKGDFQNYWFSTGTPTWLVKEIYKNRSFDFSRVQITENKLNSFEINNLYPPTLLFQTGYLTIKSFDETDHIYTLDYPNEEVRWSLNQFLMETYRQNEQEEVIPFVLKFRNALQNNNLPEAMETINTVFSSLPYDLWQKENERFYHALIHIMFTLLGVYIQSEIHSANGRCDALVHTQKYIYAFEFKLDKTASEALVQIETKGYLTPHQQSSKLCIAVGVNFSTKLKAIEDWEMKEM